MKGILWTVAALTLLAFPAPGAAKGPSAATLEGPGLEARLPLRGDLTAGGLIPAMFGQVPDPMLAKRPKGDLGPKYVVTYVLPGPTATADRIRQELYPYANGGPVTYTPPGQPFYAAERTTRGGWFRAGPNLKATLVASGLPATARAGSSDGFALGELLQPGLVLVLLLAGTVFALRRRYTRHAPAAG